MECSNLIISSTVRRRFIGFRSLSVPQGLKPQNEGALATELKLHPPKKLGDTFRGQRDYASRARLLLWPCQRYCCSCGRPSCASTRQTNCSTKSSIVCGAK